MITTILVCILGLLVLVLLAALVMPKKFNIISDSIINRPQAEVFNYIRHIRNQEHYSKWVMADPSVKIVYTGTDGEVGFISSWSSGEKNVGVGTQEIIKVFPDKGYEVEIRFEKPFKGTSYAEAVTGAISETQTKMTTTFKTSMPFPMNIMAPMFTKFLKKDMDETSANLKRVLEKQH